MEREQYEIKRSSMTDERFCFVVAGEMGAGKSTLINTLANLDMVKTGSGASTVTTKVEIHDNDIEFEMPLLGVNSSKMKVRAVDTPGLNDEEISYEQIFREVAEKVPHPHALFYCFQINTRFRLSDRQLLSVMTSCYGADIWKRVVIVLTHADQVQSPMEDMKSRKEAIVKFLTDKIKLDESVVSKIPFCLAALKPSFVPCDYAPGPVGEGQIPEYDWKMELLSAAVSVVPPDIASMILKLHEQGVLAWLKRNGREVIEAAKRNKEGVLGVGAGVGAILGFILLR